MTDVEPLADGVFGMAEKSGPNTGAAGRLGDVELLEWARRFYAHSGWRDRGVFEHSAPIAGGFTSLAALRYEKRLLRP